MAKLLRVVLIGNYILAAALLVAVPIMKRSSIMRVGFLGILFFLLSTTQAVQAQTAPSPWAAPQPVNELCCAAYPVPVADPWGQLHLFWVDTDGYIWYSRTVEDRWTEPIEILANPNGGPAAGLDVTVDVSGMAHALWRGGSTGSPLYYSNADILQAGNAQAWSVPVELAPTALGAAIAVDAAGTIYVAYTPFEAAASFVLITSPDGLSWTPPAPAASPLTPDFTGGSYVSLAVADDGVIHVAWNSQRYPGGYPEHAVYYQHSEDEGRTWSEAYDPDPLPAEVDANTESNFKNKMLKVAVGPTGVVDLTWHQYTGSRFHRRSTDGGNTWSDKIPVFPEMGAAFNGPVDMAFDSAGRLHFVAARNGIWYRSLSTEGQWTPPELVDPTFADWHHQRVAVVNGNVVHLFYADINDTGLIWTAHRTAAAPALTPQPLPTLASPGEAQPAAQPTVQAGNAQSALLPQAITTAPTPLPDAFATPRQTSPASLWIWILTPVLLLIGATMVRSLLTTRSRR